MTTSYGADDYSGKSYLGVVLVRALLLIRTLWLKKTTTVGTPPILVLSYKNHAIDEFLVDLVNAEQPHTLRNKLIRIGGQCKDARLAQFSEQFASQSDFQVKIRRQLLVDLDSIKCSINVTFEGDVASFLSYRHSMFSTNDQSGVNDPQSRRKAAMDATAILMESIARWRMLTSAIHSIDSNERPSPRNVAKKFSFLELDKNGEASQQLRSYVNTTPGNDFIRILDSSSAHMSFQHWGDVLLSWLCGKELLPLCKYSPDCGELSLSPNPALCNSHRCSFLTSDQVRCHFSTLNSVSPFCERHSCRAESCLYARLSDLHPYCLDHACKKCVSIGTEANLATDEPPRNVCESHPMCIMPSCQEFCFEGRPYCSKHLVISSCSAFTKKGRPCKAKAISRSVPFCDNHRHLHQSVFDVDGMDDLKLDERANSAKFSVCIATTRKGKPCKGVPLPGSKYCYDHSPPETTDTMQGQKFQREVVVSVSSAEIPPTEEGQEQSDLAEKVHSKVKSSQNGPPNDDDNSSCSFHDCLETETHSVPNHIDEFEYEEEEGENLQHLREVFEVNDGPDLEGTREEDDAGIDGGTVQETVEESLGEVEVASDPSEWSWEMTLDERWDACQSLMEKVKNLLKTANTRTRIAIAEVRKDLQRAQVQAKARIYENKSIIGGTMVGCIARLEAIRTTRPFAVVVEEASEVLEPLLFSCLSESTVKLEMIGDHRQLQPSINDRFDFQKYNKINVSMFQRLIEAPAEHTVPSTVLSVQRRMRKNIADLTRGFYSDITSIEDHEAVSRQVIGQRRLRGSSTLVASTATGGREVPGLDPHVYLWTHNGDQRKSNVGVSRINPKEAEMACSLVAYLVTCGVPRSSIAVLTPYKGQQNLIRTMLIKDSKFSSLRLLSKDPTAVDVCRLSTVDRFQGDEEDIIICSLVVDKSSRTGFVKLVNRMIVLLSRARLGLFVLGNIGYFQQQSSVMPSHWTKTFELLQTPAPDDSFSAGGSPLASSAPRTGRELPLCCPVHRHIKFDASCSADLNLGFCNELCEHTLTCGHLCSLKCHWPKPVHNTNCAAQLDSPCMRHAGKITCHHLLNNAPGTLKGGVDLAVTAYKCPEMVESTLPCGHTECLPCWKESQAVNGSLPWPDCPRPSPTPYTFSCGHSMAVTCAELVDFTQNPNKVKCEADEVYHPGCGHSIYMKCWRKMDFESGVRNFACRDSQQVILPRCGHEQTSVPCHIAQSLATWTGTSCDEVGKILEGVLYGAQDFKCSEPVKLVRTCGHEMSLPCSTAFTKVQFLGKCQELVKTQHPICGHDCSVMCQHMSSRAGTNTITATAEVHEGAASSLVSLPAGVPKCEKMVRLVRKCGHIQKVKCWRARSPLVGCEEEVQTVSPLCGCKITVMCKVKNQLEKPLWDAGVFAKVRDTRQLSEDDKVLRNLGTLGSDVEGALQSCQRSISLRLKCGHVKEEVRCSSLLRILHDKALDCSAQVTLRLRCGHDTSISCSKAQLYNTESVEITCKEDISKPCWNHMVCHQILKAKCGFVGDVACKKSTIWTCPLGKHSHKITQCIEGTPLSCPDCVTDTLRDAINDPQEFSGGILLSQILTGLPTSCIEWLHSPSIISRFLEQEQEMLIETNRYIESIPLWERPVLRLQRIPCFRVLKGVSNQTLDSFDPSKLVKKETLMGLLTQVLTPDTLIGLVSGISDEEEVTILLGFAAISRTKVLNLPNMPRNKKKRANLWREIQSGGFSSLKFVDDLGCDNLVTWYPFPLVALCRLRLKKEHLSRVAQNLSEEKPYSFECSTIQRSVPPKQIVPSQPFKKVESSVVSLNEQSIESNGDIGHSARALEETILEGCDLDMSWNKSGGISSKGAFPDSTEADLRDKMQFLKDAAPPFAGLKLLRNLSKSLTVDTPLLSLLQAAELIKHEPVTARSNLYNYIEKMKALGEGNILHPWALVVASRLERERKPVQSLRLLEAFHDLFPTHQQVLTKEELDCLLNTSESDNDDDQSMKANTNDQLLDEWNDLKGQYPSQTNSDATEKLLSMTGLTRIKKEALDLWRLALQLQQMDSSKRKKNYPSTNYCFLGNPGKFWVSLQNMLGILTHHSHKSLHVRTY